MDEHELALAFGVKLRQKRRQVDITQQELADLVGVTRIYISMIERGETSITLEKVYRLAKALNCTLSEILPQDTE